MPVRLSKIPFTEDLLKNHQVLAFDCGTAEWETEVAEVLKRPKGVGGLVDISPQEGMSVWVYVEANGDMVGFGSIGPGQLKWPKTKSDPRPSSVIPWLGVASAFRGRGYGKDILRDLIDVAKEQAAERRIVVLSVHEKNPANKFYTDHNFALYGKPRSYVNGGPRYVRYVLDLWPNGQPPQ